MELTKTTLKKPTDAGPVLLVSAVNDDGNLSGVFDFDEVEVFHLKQGNEKRDQQRKVQSKTKPGLPRSPSLRTSSECP